MASTSSWLEKHKSSSTRFNGSTISLSGLGVEDAIRILDTKISRAAQSGSLDVRIVLDRQSTKMKNSVLSYLEHSKQVAQFDEGHAQSGTILVKLNQPASNFH